MNLLKLEISTNFIKSLFLTVFAIFVSNILYSQPGHVYIKPKPSTLNISANQVVSQYAIFNQIESSSTLFDSLQVQHKIKIGSKSVINNDDKIGIGTTTPEYEMDVCGTIRASVEILLEENEWCDYVFNSDYNLENFNNRINTIKTQKHLPYILPEKSILEFGLPVSETIKGIVHNIEDMYLYMEILKNKIEELEKENKILKEKLEIK